MIEKYINRLYSFHGRFTRSQFLGYSLLNMTISIVLGVPLIFGCQTDNPGLAILIAMAMLIVFGAGFWSNYAVLTKRLHDLGYSGLNSIWIFLLDMGSIAFDKTSPVLSILFSLGLLGVILYLVFKPGEIYHNHFGESTI